MLASADKNGEIQASIPGLARRAAVSIPAAEAALAKFLAPDPYSRTKLDDGRRIVEIAGGWALLNYEMYRRMASWDEQREKNAERQRRFRERHKRNVEITGRNALLHESNGVFRQAEAEADSDSESDAEKKDSEEQILIMNARGKKHGTRLPEDWQLDDAGRAYARERGLDPDETANAFKDHWHASSRPTAVKRDWAAAFRTWCRNSNGYGQPGGGKGASTVRPRRGNNAMLEQLALIARRPDDE